MFKGLKDKITASDSSSRNKSSSVNNSDSTVDEIDQSATEQTVSGLSSLSSLFAQSTTKTVKKPDDTESVSEYDDSVAHGDIFSKEELFKKYQKSQALTKRYKLKSIEAVEGYKKLQWENAKLIQTLTESQDVNIRKVAELKAELELDKKTKYEIEENCRLMIEEKNEMINVLRLQISLLRDGTELSTNSGAQIKDRDDNKIKNDEITELKSNISKKDGLLFQCKEKIKSLNSQLAELKMKYDNVIEASLADDKETEKPTRGDLEEDNVIAHQNLKKNYDEKIRNIIEEYEKEKVDIEYEIKTKFEQDLISLKKELDDSNVKMNRIRQDNERLEEQVSIKTKIIEDLMTNEGNEIKNLPKKTGTTVEQSECYEISSLSISQEFDDIKDDNKIDETKEDSIIDDLKEEIKFLTSRIEQMENLKAQTEEETSKIEDELKKVEIILKKEREEFEIKSNSLILQMDEVKSELNISNSKCQELSLELNNVQTALLKKKKEIEENFQDHSDLERRCENLDLEIKNLKEENIDLSTKLQKADNYIEEIEQQILTVRVDLENQEIKVIENEILYKKLQDKNDEISSALETEICEKNKLLSLLNGGDKYNDSTLRDQDGLGLKIVEMRQRYDNHIADDREQIRNLEVLLTERNATIEELAHEIEDLRKERETESSASVLCKMKLEEIETENSRSFTVNEENMKIIEMKEELLKNLKNDKDDLERDISNIKIDFEQHKLKMEECEKENEKLKREFEFLNDDKVRVDANSIEKSNKFEQEKCLLEEELSLLKDNNDMIQKKFEDLKNNFDQLEKERFHLDTKLQLSLKESEEKILKHKEMIYGLEGKINVFRKYLKMFRVWNEEAISLSNSENYNNSIDLENREYWSKDFEEECDGIEEISSLGLLNGRILLSLHDIHCQLKHKQNSENDKIIKFIKEIKKCLAIDDQERDFNEIEILDNICSLRLDVEKSKNVLIETEKDCEKLEKMIKSDDFVDENIGNSSSITRLRTSIVERLNFFKKLLNEKEKEISSIKADMNEKTKKCEKLISDKMKQLKNISNIFELSDINFENKAVAKEVFRGLKDYINERNRLSIELHETQCKLKEVECEFENKSLEVQGLKESVNEERAKLVSMRHEFDECASEKDRLDQEKQSLKKELTELNEKVHNMKTNFEAQYSEKDKLIKNFDELLDKLKTNYLVLEVNYRSDIEEDCGCGDEVEKMTLPEMEARSHSEVDDEDTFKVKLAQVVCQSDRLVKLYNRHKALFDGMKIESKNSKNRSNQSELKVEELTKEIAVLSSSAEELRAAYDHMVKERDSLNAELDCLISEKQRSMETVIALQNDSINMESEKSQFIDQIKVLEEMNREIESELKVTKDSFETAKIDLKEMKNAKLTLKAQLEEEYNSCYLLKNEILSLSNVIEELKAASLRSFDEREMMKIEIESLSVEKEKSMDVITNLKSITQNMEVENSDFLEQIKNLETVNRDIEAELKLVQESLDTLKIEFEDMTKSKSKLSIQLEDEQNNCFQLKNEIEMLSNNLEELKNVNRQILDERDVLKIELQSLNSERQRSLETLDSLQTLTQCIDVEKSQSLVQIRNLEEKYQASDEELKMLQHSMENMKGELEETKEQKLKLTIDLEAERTCIRQLKVDIDILGNDLEELKKSLENVTEDRDNVKSELDSLRKEKDKSMETLIVLQNGQAEIQVEKSQYQEQIKQLDANRQASEAELNMVQHTLEEIKKELENSTKYKNKLISELEEERKHNCHLRSEIEKYQNEIKVLKTKCESRKMKLKTVKEHHKKEIFEMKQQFSEEQSINEDGFNSRIKKLSKEFNDALLLKEQEFQISFQSALENARSGETHQKADLKLQIDHLTETVIELEIERSTLLTTISDCKEDIEKSASQLLTKESQIESLANEISCRKSQISDLEEQISKMKLLEEQLEHVSKQCQTVDSCSYYAEESLDTVNVDDHDVLQMHCDDLEAQVKQLHLENICLKNTITQNQTSPSLSSQHEQVQSASRSYQLGKQPFSDNISIKSSTIMNLRSTNNSSSDYQFCPYPITESTEYDYLRNILVKYMTGLETCTLARVLCTVMKLSREETDHILRFEEDKKKVLQIQLFPR